MQQEEHDAGSIMDRQRTSAMSALSFARLRCVRESRYSLRVF